MKDFAGRIAVVTGGGTGMGRELVRQLVAEGCNVAMCDVSAQNMAETQRLCEQARPPQGTRITTHIADVSDEAQVQRFRDEVAARQDTDKIHLLFNNAGIGGISPLHQWDPDEWNRMVSVNLTGVFLGFRAAIPHIRAAGGGSVVSTASISGTRPAAGEAPYSAAKAGVAAITASAALEYAPGIRVNAVSPGMIETALTAPLLQFVPDAQERYQRTTPIGRVGQPGDIADVVVFLCSDLARFITGQNLVVDGGMTLHGSGVDGIFEQIFTS